MGLKLTTRRIAAWLACFAILFAALAPSVSHAVNAANGQAWAEICTASGVAMVMVGDDGASPAEPLTKQSLHLEHCPFCCSHGGSLALLPGAGMAIPPIATQEARPSLFFHSPHPLPIWTSAQSRAPPAHA
jgi:hypothetical protein